MSPWESLFSREFIVTYTLVIVQSLLLFFVPHRAPVSGTWSGARFESPAVWTMGHWRWLEHSSDQSPVGNSDEASSPMFYWAMKSELAKLSTLDASAIDDSLSRQEIVGGVQLSDRIETPSLQDSPAGVVERSPELPSLALDQYASATRLYFVPAGLASFSGEYVSSLMSLDDSGSPVVPPIGGGGGSGGVPPPDVGGGFGHGGIPGGGGSTPEPSGAILTLIGLALTCNRRTARRSTRGRSSSRGAHAPHQCGG